MNIMSLVTKGSDSPLGFSVYWRTGLDVKGRVEVTVKANLGDDCKIAAELAVARHLLEDRNVCGHDKAGGNLTIRFSFGAIKKLLREDSEKVHLSPYANFLRARFAGANVECENRKVDWANDECDRDVSTLEVSEPIVTTIIVGGIGEVELTGHAVERYVERFGVKPERAWRRLRERAPHAKRLGRPPKSWKDLIKYPREAAFAVSSNGEMLMVVAPRKRNGKYASLTTVYPVDARLRTDIARMCASPRSAR